MGANEMRLQELLDHIPQLVWTCTPDGACDYLNRQWLDYTGAPLEAQLGQGWAERVHPDDHERMFARWQEASTTGTARSVEVRIRRHDGQYRWFDARAFPMHDAEGRITKWFGSATDITDAKLATTALRNSEHYLRTVFENMTEAIVLARTDGQIIHWNPAGLRMHGFSSMEEVLLRLPEFDKIYQLATLDGRVLPLEEWPLSRVFRGELVRDMELRVRRLDIAWERILSYSGQLVPGPEGEPLAFVTIADLTERRRATQALEDSEERLRFANEAAGIGTFVSDLETGRVHLSESYAALLDARGATELAAAEVVRRLHPDDVADAAPRIKAATDPDGDGRLSETMRILRPDGSTRWVQFSFRTLFRETPTGRIPFRRVGAAVDITELRRAQGRLATQNSVSRVLADAASLSEATPRIMQAICESEGWQIGAIWHVDRDARVLRCAEVWHRPGNGLEALAESTRSLSFAMGAGLPGRVWALGRPLVIDIETDTNYTRKPAAVAAGLRSAMAFPILLAGEVTGVIDFLGRDMPAADDKLLDMFSAIGQQLGAFFERKRVEREWQGLEAQLRQAHKMDALGQLSGGIAHDFNNILTAIIGNLRLAQESADPTEVSECLAEIGTASERARQLVSKILTFSRKQPQDRHPVTLTSIVKESVELLRATIPAGVELWSSVAANAPPVLADPTQIHQLVVNLGTNGWHALEGRAGRLEIGVSRVVLDQAQAARLGLASGGVYCHLSVTDDGIGMDAATQERIFDPFFTTKESGRGTGLGLSVVYGIVRSHEGAIRVTSAPGKGTTFDVYLPGISEAARSLTPVPPAARRGAGQQILYVDDEPALVALIERAMTRRGYKLTGHTRPDEAVEAFRSDPGKFALVLTDMNMPVLSGLQVAQEILQIRRDVPVLLISGNVTQDLQDRAEILGIREILHKPSSIDELADAFWRILTPP